jgi:LuxR family maltose regulon positive regulatory protein
MMVVESVALSANHEKEKAFDLLEKALALAEPQDNIRLFLNEGMPMAELLSAAAVRDIRPAYVNKLLVAFEGEPKGGQLVVSVPASSSLVEPLSPREMEVLRLIAQGLSNQEICKRLFLALDTVKGHNRRIFEKLQVKRRTEAIARARELGLI